MVPLVLLVLASFQATPTTSASPTARQAAPAGAEVTPSLAAKPTPPPLLAAPVDPPVARTYALALLRVDPGRRAGTESQSSVWEREHAAVGRQALEQGALLAVATVTAGAGDLRGLWIGSSSNVADVEALLATSPAVRSGHLKVELRTALSTASLIRRAATLRARAGAIDELAEYQLVLVRQGARFDPKAEVENRQLAMARQAWLEMQQQAGHLLLAAPFTDAGDWKGLLLLKTGALEAARALAASDPTVRTERFAAEVYSIRLPTGLLE